MVNVVVVAEVKEAYFDIVKEEIKKLVAETVKEEGCIMYNAYYSTNTPNTICMIEQWETQEALDKHFVAAHIKAYKEKTDHMFVSKKLNFLDQMA